MLRKVKSIKFFIYSVLFMLILSLGISVLFFLYNSERQKQQYADILNRNEVLSEMILQVDNISLQFDLLNRSNNSEYYELYMNDSANIDVNASKLLDIEGNDKTLRRYVRTITNMNDYQSQMVLENYDDVNGLTMGFEDRKFIQILLIELQGVMGEMIAYDLEHQNDINQTKFENLNDELQLSFITLGSFVMVLIFVNIFMLTSITRRLKKIVEKSKSLSRREWDVADLDEKSFLEFNQLAMAVNQMKKDIVSYIKEVEVKNQLQQELLEEKLNVEIKEKLLKQSQLNTLQAQVNPHFLFNTLNIIGKSAVINDVDNVLQLIESISFMMRYVIDNQEELVTIEEEIQHTKHYLGIQKLRFQKHFTYEIHIDEQSRLVMMPSMIIQPIVENCFKYAFKNNRDNRLRISVLHKEATTNIEVYDNGMGIDGETLKNIYDMSTVGLGNVYKRLELHFEKSGLLEVQSEFGCYTLVTIKVPHKEMDKWLE